MRRFTVLATVRSISRWSTAPLRWRCMPGVVAAVPIGNRSRFWGVSGDMRHALAVGLLVLWAVAVACAGEPIPEAVDRSAPAEEPVPVLPAGGARAQSSPSATEATAAPEQTEQEKAVRNRVLIMRLEQDLYIYPYPSLGLHEGDNWRSGALLLTDGWLEGADGQVWLRLDMNQERVGWIRLADSPLSLEEAQTLAEVRFPVLPIVELRADSGETVGAAVLGRSEDGRHFAVEVQDRTAVRVWVHRRSMSAAHSESELDDLGRLPVYSGPIWGAWTPSSESPLAEATSGGWLAFAGRPSGEYAEHVLAVGASHSILGRSVDGEWVALRVDTLRPEYVWAPADSVRLKGQIAAAPIYVGKWMQTMSVDASGNVGQPSATSEPLYHWQWRSDGTIVGSNSDGLWHWHPASGELRRFAEPQWVTFSPDGRYAASGCCQDYQAGDLMRDITITPVEGAEPIVFVDANRWHFTHHSEDPSLRWSPDSTHLLSDIHGDAETGEEARRAILGVDGSRVEMPGLGDAGWLPDGTLYHLSDGTIGVYGVDGSLIGEIAFDGWPMMHVGVSKRLQAVGQSADHPRGYALIDLTDGSATQMPAPLDLGPRDSNASGWRPLLFIEDSLYFFWAKRGRDPLPDGPLLYRYDLESGAAAPVDGSAGYGFGGWPRVQDQCPDGCERFALSSNLGPLLIIDPARSETIAVPLPAGARSSRVIDWSQDGAQLLVRVLRETSESDEAGFATHSGTWVHRWEFGVSEYLIIDARSGSVLQLFRSPVEQCWSNGHTGRWSRDGQWLAFGGQVVDCT